MKELMSKGPPRQLLLDTTGDEKFKSWGVEVHSFEEMTDYAYRTDNFRIRWTRPPRSPLTIDAVSWLAMARGEEAGDTLIAVDEIQFYVSKQWNTIPQSFQDACLVGRHTNTLLIATSQRPALIHNDFLSQAQRYYVFKLVLADDIQSLKHIIPDIAKVTRLEVGKYLTYP